MAAGIFPVAALARHFLLIKFSGSPEQHGASQRYLTRAKETSQGGEFNGRFALILYIIHT